MKFLLKDRGFSAEQGWGLYRRVVSWWSFRLPTVFLIGAALSRLAMDLMPVDASSANIVGMLFVVTLLMSLASAMRLITIRNTKEAKKEWVEFEDSLAAGNAG